MEHNLKATMAAFQVPGEFLSGERYGSGHINDTYAVTFRNGDRTARYILQRINHNIFRNPELLMANIERVTRHLKKKALEAGNADPRSSLTLVPACDGKAFYKDPEGNYWRVYDFIEGARTYDVLETPEQAFQAAKAFGEFQKLLSDLPGERLVETIPHFHDTPKRLEALLEAAEKDPLGRRAEVQPELDFILARRDLTRHLLDLHAQGLIPERITHNDTKLNNVMLDDQTKQGICVIDLDTVMPGLALYDFGDMVRTATSPRPEDETNLSLIEMRMPMFQALVDGYLSATHDVLTPAERENIAFSGKLITLEIGIRFLTDYLLGDVYFRIKRERHNLDRCRSQLRLVECIESQEAAMNDYVRNWTPKP